MSLKIKCPFCGSCHLSLLSQIPIWGGEEKELHIICDDCACSAPEYVWTQYQRVKDFEKDSHPSDKA
ncbi:hypothetical protein L3V77_08915 [Vibrio sp. DW001]|uniref:hypothetical protein n=1 Tax=Vibrio sp. DW001 TaxID=2912315 RepID=UPI0023B074E0|nr:hypothetical protein [Vibrio sp. DW001]WED25208.1 hypothetical protein L3V77_08915 [Vibrio sp. DW001]